MHSFDLAIADYVRCTELEPERPGPRFNLASTRLRAGKTQECIHDCHILIRDNPDYSWGWELRGEAYEKLAQFDKALQDYNQAIAVEPAMASGYIARGRMHERQQRYKEAMSDYEQACTVQPENQRGREALDSLKARLAADPAS
jgi:tetratricopeptide (TPR) repeat protein